VVNEALIASALVVLCVVGMLILLELRRGRRAAEARRAEEALSKARRRRAKGSRKEEIPEEETRDEDEEYVTRYTRKSDLPTLETGPESREEGTASEAITLFEEGTEADEPTGSKKIFVVCAAGQSDRGQIRKRNEDSILLLEDHSLFVVADGMGGYAGGDVASKLACDTIERVFRSGPGPDPGARPLPKQPRPPRAEELVVALEAANDAIRAEARKRSGFGRMGATIVGARFMERKQRAFIGHIGDSRCYRLRRGELRLLTQDHTMAAKGIEGPMGHHVRRALGVTRRVQVDMLVDKPQPDDVYVLCSDGLNKMVDDEMIAVVLSAHSTDLEAAVRALIEKANQFGGKDNVSVVLIGIRPPMTSPKVA
jgi:serine/threonine protein phosphatase PrpC